MDSDVTKNLFLQELHNRNETLYHRLLVDNVEELAPLIYTPTVGHVCQQFGSQYVRARGMYAPRATRRAIRRRAILSDAAQFSASGTSRGRTAATSAR